MSTRTSTELHDELDRLIHLELPALLRFEHGPGDAADVADRAAVELEIAQVTLRIERLQDRLTETSDIPDDAPAGTVSAGRVVTLDFGDGDHERFVLGVHADPTAAVPVLTLSSPLGSALLGATVGTTVTYRTPAGSQTAQIVAVSESGLVAA